MAKTLAEHKHLCKLFLETREDFETFAPKDMTGKEKEIWDTAIKVLRKDPKKYSLVYYEETKNANKTEHKGHVQEFSKDYWEQFEIRAAEDNVHVLHEFFDETVFFTPKSSSLFIVREKEVDGNIEYVVGIFESDTPITSTTLKHDAHNNICQ